MKKLLILGSVVSACPPKKQGGTERVAYYQAKQLAKNGIKIIFAGAKGTSENFRSELEFEKERRADNILSGIEFVEVGGGTALGSQEDALKFDRSQVEASRKLRLEIVNIAKVQKLMIERQDEYDVILNNLRGEAVLFETAKHTGKKLVNVMHLNIFDELAELFSVYNIGIITIANHQRKKYPNLNHLTTIFNPVNTDVFSFCDRPKDYALMVSTVGEHKNQADAIAACQKAGVPLVIAGKIRDEDYFKSRIEPHIGGSEVTYLGELSFEDKLKLYEKAKVFLFPVIWSEPFGLVCIEALSCGTPVIAYPNGGPKDIVKDGENGFFANSPDEMADKIGQIGKINRESCRRDCEERFSENTIGKKYLQTIKPLL